MRLQTANRWDMRPNLTPFPHLLHPPRVRYGPVLSAAAKVATLLLGCVGAALTCAVQAAGPPSAGPLIHEFSMTLAPHTRTEAAGPFFYREAGEGFSQWALPPW